jgi:hypothetical protein
MIEIVDLQVRFKRQGRIVTGFHLCASVVSMFLELSDE